MRYEKVVVTGGSGLLGRFVVGELIDRCAVTVLDIAPPKQDVAFVRADILDLPAVGSALAGQDAVIHLAGIDDGKAERNKDYFETNVQGAWNVFHAAEVAGVRQIVAASSTAALGLGSDRMPDYLPIDEDHPLYTTGTYGLTKQVIETVARQYARRGRLRAVCLRPTLIVRPEMEPAYLAQLALDDPDRDPPAGFGAAGGVTPCGALSATRSYVRSRDAARCFRLALDYDGEDFGLFNVSALDSIGRVETLTRMAAVYGRRPQLRDAGLYAKDPCASVLSISRTADALGWMPDGDWRAIVAAHHGAEAGAPLPGQT